MKPTTAAPPAATLRAAMLALVLLAAAPTGALAQQYGEAHNVFLPRLYQAAPLTDYPVGLSASGSETQDGWDWIADAGGTLTMRHPASYQRSTQLLFGHTGDLYLRKPLGGSDPAWGDWQQVLVKRGGLVRTRGSRLGFAGQVGFGTATPS